MIIRHEFGKPGQWNHWWIEYPSDNPPGHFAVSNSAGRVPQKQMQLQKQARKAQQEPKHKLVKLESFNPVMKPGYEIAAFIAPPDSRWPNHCVVTTQQRRVGV